MIDRSRERKREREAKRKRARKVWLLARSLDDLFPRMSLIRRGLPLSFSLNVQKKETSRFTAGDPFQGRNS